MRDGKLLAEENPSVLLNQYQCDDLEAVFLKLIFEEQQIKPSQLKNLRDVNIFLYSNMKLL